MNTIITYIFIPLGAYRRSNTCQETDNAIPSGRLG